MQARTRCVGLTLIAASSLLVAVTAAQAASPGLLCQSGKNKTAGKYAACVANAQAKLTTSGDWDSFTRALYKCSTRYSTTWQRLDQKALEASGLCPAEWSTVQARADAFTWVVATQVAGVRFIDNGNGTVTDLQTGLQWEQKTTTVESGSNWSDPHDVDNFYYWNLSSTGENPNLPNGNTYTDFLAKLNGAEGEACFVNKCDWRLPTLEELTTILLAPYPCGTSPCINPIFGPTATYFYWSHTTHSIRPMHGS